MSTLIRKPKPGCVSTKNFPILVKFCTIHRPKPCSSPEIQLQPLPKPALQSLILSRYRGGKFHGLLQNVIATPSLLLTACHNLRRTGSTPTTDLTLDSVSVHFFSLKEISLQLSTNSLDVESCCASFSPEDPNGALFVVPDLKLKVVMEAIRIVLEAIYDDRFATFSYGGRVNMGRHTAVRYLKTSVQNPTWWFTVKFDKGPFESRHVVLIKKFKHCV